jgi:nitrogen-specific signal transduction histidine kinase
MRLASENVHTVEDLLAETLASLDWENNVNLSRSYPPSQKELWWRLDSVRLPLIENVSLFLR